MGLRVVLLRSIRDVGEVNLNTFFSLVGKGLSVSEPNGLMRVFSLLTRQADERTAVHQPAAHGPGHGRSNRLLCLRETGSLVERLSRRSER